MEATGFKKRKYGLLLLLFLVAAGGGWWCWQSGRQEPQALPPVKDDGRVLSEGIVFPVRYAQIVMPVEGTIGEIFVQEGALVRHGQPLLRLVRQDVQARVRSVDAAAAKAAAAVEQAEVNLADARREWFRQRQLADNGGISRQQMDQAQTMLERSLTVLAQAKEEWRTQQESLRESQEILDKSELRAPMAGRVSYLDKRLGERADIGTVLVRIADESEWEVRSDDLTELSIAKVREGAPVTLTFDGIPDLELQGRVKFIRPYGEKKRGDITYTVTIAPASWDERLRWNMTAQIAISPVGSF